MSFISESLPYLGLGIVLGLAAGLSPGPLLTLVLSETLKYGKRAGIRVASVPILTDIPIVIVSVFVLARLSNLHLVLGTITVGGAMFLAYLAYESLTVKGIERSPQGGAESLRKGMGTNLLNPHPYLFWTTVGAPTVLKGYNVNPLCGILFVVAFYLFLVGSKIIVALIVDRSRLFLKREAFISLNRALGVMLALFSILFMKDGLTLFGLI